LKHILHTKFFRLHDVGFAVTTAVEAEGLRGLAEKSNMLFDGI
jgi:hypothetical protein